MAAIVLLRSGFDLVTVLASGGLGAQKKNPGPTNVDPGMYHECVFPVRKA